MCTTDSPIIENYLIQIIHKNEITRKSYSKIKKQNQRHFKKSWKTNPPDHSGKPSRWSICESIFHWARNCSHTLENIGQKNGQKNANGNDANINLFTIISLLTFNMIRWKLLLVKTFIVHYWIQGVHKHLQRNLV